MLKVRGSARARFRDGSVVVWVVFAVDAIGSQLRGPQAFGSGGWVKMGTGTRLETGKKKVKGKRKEKRDAALW